jgi:hypothetical protein
MYYSKLKRYRHAQLPRLKFDPEFDWCVRAMKKEMPILLFLVGLGLLLFFIYAAVSIGFDAVAFHRSNMSALVDSVLGFLGDNKIILSVAVAVLVVVRLFVRTPRQARM